MLFRRRARRRTLVALVALGASTTGALACVTVLGLDDFVPDLDDGGTTSVSSTGTGGGGSCSGACSASGCGACPTVPLVEVPLPDGGRFEIDAYETTNREYAAWLATHPTLDGQRTECQWNDSFTPGVPTASAIEAANDAGSMIKPDGPCFVDDWLGKQLDLGHGSWPVVCIDWCDAAAYCAWAGKRLCGKIDQDVGLDITISPGAYKDASASQWYRACSKAGTLKFPYGNTYQKGWCNDSNSNLRDAGAYTQCEGGYPGLFDMSGNANEWEDACTSYNSLPELTNCCRRGGAFFDTDAGLACAVCTQGRRCIPSNNLGFRCCSG